MTHHMRRARSEAEEPIPDRREDGATGAPKMADNETYRGMQAEMQGAWLRRHVHALLDSIARLFGEMCIGPGQDC